MGFQTPSVVAVQLIKAFYQLKSISSVVDTPYFKQKTIKNKK